MVFDSKLPIKHALRALSEHDIKCAPIWNSEKLMFTGFMTVTDFADILSHYYSNNKTTFSYKISEFENCTVSNWSEIRKLNNNKNKKTNEKTENKNKKNILGKLINCNYNQSLYDAVCLLDKHFIHRIPIMKEENGKSILGILNYSKILRFVLQKMEESYRTSINIKIKDMNIFSLMAIIF